MKKFLVAIFLISTVLAVDCNYCKDSISEKPYNVYGRKYHKSCFICHHCNEAIKEGLKYSFDEHMYHANNSCNVLCESCYLRKGIEYSNGIIQCEECHNKIVQTPEDILIHKTYVLELLSRYGFNDLSGSNISIEVVNDSQMRKVMKKGLFGKIYHLFFGFGSPEGYTVHIKKGIGKNKKHSCKIYIIDNMHELDFRATLAHEYLHAWMMINNIYSYYWKFNDLSMTEGFAQLGSYLVFTDEGSMIGNKKIEFDLDLYDDPNYGEGYRRIKVCLDYFGWNRLIQKVLNKEDLPCFNDKNLLYLNRNQVNS